MKRRKTRSRKKPGPRTKPAKEPNPAKGTQPQITLPDRKQLEELSERFDRRELLPGDYQTLLAICDFHVQLPELLRREGMTVQRLRELMWGERTEPTDAMTDDGPNHQTPRNGDSGVDA
mgnify:CR=1 FL=1